MNGPIGSRDDDDVMRGYPERKCIGGFHVRQVSLIITQVKSKIAYH